jgi:hypothetical protein
MAGLGFIWAYAVVEVLGYDSDAVVQPPIDVDVLHSTKCVCVFWNQADAEAEARQA